MGQSIFIETASVPFRRHVFGRDCEGDRFVGKSAAIRFATFETDHQPEAVVFVPEHVVLPLSGTLP